ncbi:hypothetical protein FDI24_gp014 [Acidovorax phage ACP17]|uniref:Uncharacterized protein n=1 Tax=Acidovorax phage ACP17 TaxID=2010329 RepID=A0A218M3D3_9CAUD|nr:hypothetical protein FDI24_gp014 [Acidovorax phage ACP17]ASD50548.1 hypothetical protein [Acidovorax phage ACP17]
MSQLKISSDGWIRVDSEEEFLEYYPPEKWGEYRPQPWLRPARYPVLMQELTTVYNSNGADHAMLFYIYDFEEIEE